MQSCGPPGIEFETNGLNHVCKPKCHFRCHLCRKKLDFADIDFSPIESYYSTFLLHTIDMKGDAFKMVQKVRGGKYCPLKWKIS